MKNAVLLSALLSIFAMTLWAGTTGKIAGRIRSTETGEAVVGASVMVDVFGILACGLVLYLAYDAFKDLR